jgi:cytochrome c nitrite reductase small subunit
MAYWKTLRVPLIIGAAALLVVLGVGMYATNFTVYLGSDPTTCNNCHVMDGVYEGWYHAGHQQWATCIDCHTPHQIVLKYLYKGKSGMNHVFMFTTGNIPEPLRAIPETDRIVQANCLRCHAETVSEVADGVADPMSSANLNEAGRYCWGCHRTVAHGSRGISILPYQDKGIYYQSVYSETKPKEK